MLFRSSKRKIREIYGSYFVEFLDKDIAIQNLLYDINFSTYERKTIISHGDFANKSIATKQNWTQLKKHYKERN